MEDDLHSLKEILDDTYYKDLSLSKSQKKKIYKNATTVSKPSRILPSLKYAVSLMVAVSCLLVLVLSQIPSHSNLASKQSIREQQVALIHFQNNLIKLVENQHKAEKALLAERNFEKRSQVMEIYREECVTEGTKIIEELKQITIPSELSSYEVEMNQSLIELIKVYEKKNEFYNNLNVETYQGLPMDNESIDHLIRFSTIIGEVYEKIKLLQPNFFILFSFYN